jgi:NADH-quinone oxidoreductase subunit I
MSQYWSDIFGGFKSLLVGLSVTGPEFMKSATGGTITEQYPHEVPVMTANFRGHIELVKNEKTGLPNCIVCGMCQRACPSGCISLKGEKKEGEKKKSLIKYELDFTKCSLCGSCIESCNFKAIQFSKEYNLASTRKEDYIYDLLQRLEEQG